mgnify:CR=1 FL=1
MAKIIITVAQDANSELTIKKSRFITSVHRATNEKEARSFIDRVSTANRKATHNCFAYQCGDNNEVQRESDNGEPSGTAGVPILKALQMEDVHNTVIVVTRYFGGIKLGAGGLIRAYSNAATNGIHAAGLVKCVPQRLVQVQSSYSEQGPLANWLRKHHLTIADTKFAVNVTTTFFADESIVDQTIAALVNAFNDQLQIKKLGTHLNEVPIS